MLCRSNCGKTSCKYKMGCRVLLAKSCKQGRFYQLNLAVMHGCTNGCRCTDATAQMAVAAGRSDTDG